MSKKETNTEKNNKKFHPIIRRHFQLDELTEHYFLWIDQLMERFVDITFEDAVRLYNSLFIENKPGGVRQWKL